MTSAAENKLPYVTKEVESWSKAKEIFDALGGEWIFRGQSDCTWELQTSLERKILSNFLRGVSKEGLLEAEEILKRSFIRGSHLYRLGLTAPSNTLSWWAEMQHYGAPTRLLDFTWSPYVASFFAFENAEKSCNRAVWALNVDLVMGLLANLMVKEFPEIDESSIRNSMVWEQGDFIDFFLREAQLRAIKSIVLVATDRMNERMMAQRGLFVMPSSIAFSFMDCLTGLIGENTFPKYVIRFVLPNESRIEALMDLRRMNVTRASLFPGLEGYAQSLAADVILALEESKSPLVKERRKRRINLKLP
jgi:hypothetical protein